MKTSLALILLCFAALAGCAKNPVRVEASNNRDVDVSVLFEYDGCKMYRFYDNGRFIYFSKCLQPSQTSWTTATIAGKVVIEEPHSVSTELETR